MRKIALDIETTGLNPYEGHKIIEIGCVELLNNFPSGVVWQKYINPNRYMPQEAFEIHGLSEDFLSDKPSFSEITNEFLNFLGESDLIIHNAAFDLKFINYELELLRLEPINKKNIKVIDTIEIARGLFPGQSINLDALCKRYKIDLEKRKLHGALLDAELLAEVFLEMHGGRQQGINLDTQHKLNNENIDLKNAVYSKKIYKLKDEELENHKKLLEVINKN